MKIKSMYMKQLFLLITVMLGIGFNVHAQTAAEQKGALKQVLIMVAHPNMEQSKANAALLEAVKDLDGVQVIDMYATPFKKEAYTEAWRKADVVVFQFPFYWASAPSRLKQWCDEILGEIQSVPGVKGKKLMVATTTGSEEASYQHGGRNKYTIEELLRPYEFLANHAGMEWLAPFALYGMNNSTPQLISEGAKAYRKRISDIQRLR